MKRKVLFWLLALQVPVCDRLTILFSAAEKQHIAADEHGGEKPNIQ